MNLIDSCKSKYASLRKLILTPVAIATELKKAFSTDTPTVARKYDVNSFENSEEFDNNLSDFFSREWHTYSNSQFEELKKQADEGDAIAQYKYGRLISIGLQSKVDIDKGKYRKSEWNEKSYEVASKLVDFSFDRAVKYLNLSAEQGLGLAMNALVRLYTNGPNPDVILAVDWWNESKKLCPWSFGGLNINDFADSREKYMGESVDHRKILDEKTKEINELKEKVDKLYSDYSSAKKREEAYYAERNELEKKYDLLVKSASSSSSSSSKSSSRSSGDERVSVRIKYSTDSTMWLLLQGNGQIVTMTKAEYKKLLGDSLKARTAFVRAKFNIPDGIKITGVEISLM